MTDDDSDNEPTAESSFTSVRTLFKGGGVVLFGLILELAISFFGKLIIAQELGPVDYGGVSLGITSVSIGSILFTLGLDKGIIRYLPRSEERTTHRSILVSSFKISLPISVLVAALGVVVAPIAATLFRDPALAPIFRVFALAIPFAILMRLSLGTIRGFQQTLPKVLIQNITYPSFRFIGIIVAVSLGMGSIGVSYAYFLSYLSAALGGVYYLYTRTNLFNTSISTSDKKHELLRFSLPLVVSSAMTIVLADIDMYMLGIIGTTGEVGQYNVAYPLANLLTVGIGAFGFLFMPILSQLDASDNRDQMVNLYQLVTKWIVFAMFLPFLVLMAFPEVAIRNTFGPQYLPSAKALSVLAIGFFGHTAFGLNKNALTSLGYTREVMIDDSAVAVLNVLLNLVLIPRIGLLGAAVATTLSYGVLNLLYSYQLYKHTGIHPFTQKLITAPIVGGGVLWVVYPFFSGLMGNSISAILGSLGVSAIAYTVSAIRFGLDVEDVRLVLSFEERFGVNFGPVTRILEEFVE